jgi:hypothetical protein
MAWRGRARQGEEKMDTKRGAKVGAVLLISMPSFVLGMHVEAYFFGSVHIYHNLDEGTDLNHGQVYLDVTFPHGVAFYGLKFPGGHYWPDDRKPRWVEILPDGREKIWIDRFEMEGIDQLGPEFQ